MFICRALSPLSSPSPFPPLAPGPQHPALCPCESDSARDLVQGGTLYKGGLHTRGSYREWPLVSDLLHFIHLLFISQGASLVAQMVKHLPCRAGDPGSVPGWGRSPGEGNSYPLRYSCLENSIDRGTRLATIHRVTKSQTRLSDEHFHSYFTLCSVLHPSVWQPVAARSSFSRLYNNPVVWLYHIFFIHH